MLSLLVVDLEHLKIPQLLVVEVVLVVTELELDYPLDQDQIL
jgi:hypothetical protein